MMDDGMLVFIIAQLIYVTYKVGRIEERLKRLEKLINGGNHRNRG